jgi:hypothetical protein
MKSHNFQQLINLSDFSAKILQTNIIKSSFLTINARITFELHSLLALVLLEYKLLIVKFILNVDQFLLKNILSNIRKILIINRSK